MFWVVNNALENETIFILEKKMVFQTINLHDLSIKKMYIHFWITKFQNTLHVQLTYMKLQQEIPYLSNLKWEHQDEHTNGRVLKRL